MAKTKTTKKTVRKLTKEIPENTPTHSDDEAIHTAEIEGSNMDTNSNVARKVKAKDRNKNAPLKFSKENQIELADWLKSHPILYDRSLDEFHMPDKKNQLWETKALELAHLLPDQTVTAARLRDQWYKGLRTRYTKAKAEVEKKSKSGSSGGSVLAGKKKWIYETFGFLKDHLTQPRGQQIVSMKSKLGLDDKGGDEMDVYYMSDSEDDEDCFETVDPDQPGPSGSQVGTSNSQDQTGPRPAKRARLGRNDSKTSTGTQLLQKLQKREKASEVLQQKVEKLLSDTSDTDRNTQVAWGQWLTSVHPFIHESLWRRYVSASYKLVNDFLDQSEAITIAESQAQTLQQGQGPTQVVGQRYGQYDQGGCSQQGIQHGQGGFGQQPQTFGQHQGHQQWTMPLIPQQHITTGPQGQQLTMLQPIQQTSPSFRSVMDMPGLSPMSVTSNRGSAASFTSVPSLSSFLDVSNLDRSQGAILNLSTGGIGAMIDSSREPRDRSSLDILNIPTSVQKESGKNQSVDDKEIEVEH